MSMCMYACRHPQYYPLQMNQAAHCLPRHQTWAGYATSTDVRTQHLLTALQYVTVFAKTGLVRTIIFFVQLVAIFCFNSYHYTVHLIPILD